MNTEHPTDIRLVAITGRVSGRVQGVGFRYSMQQAAIGFGVTGWVRNLPNRCVAFHAEGNQDSLDALLSWCQSGPSFARVDEVKVDPCEASHFDAFRILQ